MLTGFTVETITLGIFVLVSVDTVHVRVTIVYIMLRVSLKMSGAPCQQFLRELR